MHNMYQKQGFFCQRLFWNLADSLLRSNPLTSNFNSLLFPRFIIVHSIWDGYYKFGLILYESKTLFEDYEIINIYVGVGNLCQVQGVVSTIG